MFRNILGRLVALPLTATLATVSAAATAQTYPAKPVTLLIAYNAGGAIDLPLRLILPRISANLGQPVVMVYRPGGGGTIATDAVIASGTDGHNLLVNGDQMVTAPHLMGKLVKYDAFRDLIPITRMVMLKLLDDFEAGAPLPGMNAASYRVRSAVFTARGGQTFADLAHRQVSAAARPETVET